MLILLAPTRRSASRSARHAPGGVIFHAGKPRRQPPHDLPQGRGLPRVRSRLPSKGPDAQRPDRVRDCRTLLRKRAGDARPVEAIPNWRFHDRPSDSTAADEELLYASEDSGSTRSRGEALLETASIPQADLSEQVLKLPAAVPSPFDGDPQFHAVFGALAGPAPGRAAANCALPRQRGVGAASRALGTRRPRAPGDPPFLRGRRFVLADCRHVPPEAAGHAGQLLFGSAAGREDLILSVDGLARLLRGPARADNRSLVLSLLATVRCRVIGIVAPHEHEEYFADDGDPRNGRQFRVEQRAVRGRDSD